MSRAAVFTATAHLARALGDAGISDAVEVTLSARGGIRVHRDSHCDDETWDDVAAVVADTVTDSFELSTLDSRHVVVGGHIDGVPVITGQVVAVMA